MGALEAEVDGHFVDAAANVRAPSSDRYKNILGIEELRAILVRSALSSCKSDTPEESV